jgi:hypothetical protein
VVVAVELEEQEQMVSQPIHLILLLAATVVLDQHHQYQVYQSHMLAVAVVVFGYMMSLVV